MEMDEKHEEEEFENTYDFPGTEGQEDVKGENTRAKISFINYLCFQIRSLNGWCLPKSKHNRLPLI